MKKRFLLFFVVTTLLLQVFSINAWAATDGRIDEVKISVNNSNGKVKFSSQESSKYKVLEEEAEELETGETENFLVTVETKNDYWFHNISRGDVTFTGAKEGVTCKSVEGDSNYLEIEVRLKRVAGKLDAPAEAWWSSQSGIAAWDRVDMSSVYGYEVQINGKTLPVTRERRMDLSPYLKSDEINTFKVRAVPPEGVTVVKKSDFTTSNELDLTGSGVPLKGRWVQEDGNWYYLGSDEKIVKNETINSYGYDYYLDSKGVMAKGLTRIGSKWYYFDYGTNGYPEGAKRYNTWITEGEFSFLLGPDGSVAEERWGQNAKGWYYIRPYKANSQVHLVYKDVRKEINGVTYGFNTEGYMMVGWNKMGNHYYYFYPEGYRLGVMAVDTFIEGYSPEGVWGNHRIDNYGRWVK